MKISREEANEIIDLAECPDEQVDLRWDDGCVFGVVFRRDGKLYRFYFNPDDGIDHGNRFGFPVPAEVECVEVEPFEETIVSYRPVKKEKETA